jgi:hypothetical protein
MDLLIPLTLLLNHVSGSKHGDSNPDIDLGYAPYTGATPLHPGTTWQYLGFFFDCALTFCEHVKHYTNKALTTVRAMLALGNSVHGLQPKHKQMWYCTDKHGHALHHGNNILLSHKH